MVRENRKGIKVGKAVKNKKKGRTKKKITIKEWWKEQLQLFEEQKDAAGRAENIEEVNDASFDSDMSSKRNTIYTDLGSSKR